MDIKSFHEIIRQQEEQLRLFRYQSTRKLLRPNTRIIDVIFLSIIYVAIIAIFITLNVLIVIPLLYEIIASILVYFIVIEFLLRSIAIKIVECYQHYASDKKRRRCLCVPSCSEYAIICLKKYEFVFALLKIKKRLFVTCKGVEYIIDKP